MKELKRNFKLLKYGYQFISNIIGGIIFWVIGLVWLFVPVVHVSDTVLGAMYVTLGCSMMTRNSTWSFFADVVSTSPRRRSLLRQSTIFYNGIAGLLGTVLGMIAFWLRYGAIQNGKFDRKGCDEYSILSESEVGYCMIFAVLVVTVLMLYYAICYKKMILSTIIFISLAMGLMMSSISGISLERMKGWYEISMPQATVISIGIFVIGFLLNCLLYKICYRWDYDKKSAGVLRKYM